MKSRTSFCNPTVLKKDITRFMPVWILYSILLLLWLPELFDDPGGRVRTVLNHMESAFLLHMIYSAVCVALLFGDLFKTRLCNGQHALPLRRECWFATHCIAGLLFSFVPNLVYTLLSMLYLQQHFYVALLWLAVTTLQYIFAFGVALLCAMAAGNRLGMAALVGLFYALVFLLQTFVQEIYIPILHGVVWEPEWLVLLIPTQVLTSSEYVDMTILHDPEVIRLEGLIAEDWLYLGMCALVGVVLGVCALLLYRKRNLEAAGDFLSVEKLKPIFPFVAAVAAEIIFFSIFYVPILGLLIGYFASKMLLERTVKVFRWKHIRWGLLLTGLYIISVVLTVLDPLGVAVYVPRAEQVGSVQCYTDYDRYRGETVRITGQAQMESITHLHKQLTGYKEYTTDSSVTTLYITYRLENGRTVQREYRVDVASTPGQEAQKLLSSYQQVFNTEDWQAFKSKVAMIKVEDNDTATEYEYIHAYSIQDPGWIRLLLDAMYADCQQGSMAQSWAFHRDNDKGQERASLVLYDVEGEALTELIVYRDSVNTCNALDGNA